MKTVTLRELHEKTGRWVRSVEKGGEVEITDRGRTIAKIVPQKPAPEIPYFARNKPSPAFERLRKAGKLRGGTDSTITISEDRDRR